MTPQPDPLEHRCAHTDRGERCPNVGTFSWSTKGGGPWLCRAHFFPHDPLYVAPRYDSPAPLPDDHKKPDRRDWARRILHRKTQGETLPLLSLQFARDALELPPEPQREPGDDDETPAPPPA